MNIRKYLPIVLIIMLLSCNSRKNEYDPYTVGGKTKKPETKAYFEVDFKKTETNVKTIHIKLNDSNGYDALFDTGCSSMLISTLELVELVKSGTLTGNDYVGESVSTIADGTQIKNPIYNIRQVTIVDKDGKPHTLRDIKATVVDNPGADVLIGSAVIDNIAKKQYTVDLKKKVIRFE